MRRSDLDETRRVKHERAARQAALALIILLAPFLLLGALLTLSVFGAIFGVPLLLLTVPPAIVARRVRGSPSDSERLGRFAVASTFVAVALTLTIVTLVVVGLDDLDAPPDFAALAVAVGWAAAAWWTALRGRNTQCEPVSRPGTRPVARPPP